MKVAILGYGNIGSGVAKVLSDNREIIKSKVKQDVTLKYVLDLREFKGDPNEDKVVHEIDTIVNDPEIKVICETMGGVEPAFTFSKKALMKGISVCTSNKELVAAKGPELLELAKENNCNYFFEASVGGGIPIIRAMNECLMGENVESIRGILNGTTNYILTKMQEEGAEFADALKDAQDLGYAERNPEADVEGHDACRKIAILSSLMTGKTVSFEDIYTEGITKITGLDFAYAKALKKGIKLIAMSKKTADGVCAMVAPFMLPKSHPLCGVNDAFNAVYVHGNMLDDTMYYGRGAGKLPTASAVVADMMQAAKHEKCTVDCFWAKDAQPLLKPDMVVNKFFVRFNAKEADLENATKLLASDEVIQIPEDKEGFAIVSKAMSESDFEKIEKELSGVAGRIRLED